MLSLPAGIRSQLMNDRDPHGNVVVSRIETEKLLIAMVKKKLDALKGKGVYKGKFAANAHFFGYEGRSAAPSNFDANYTYAIGYTAVVLGINKLTGYLSSVRGLVDSSDRWKCGGVPLTMMMNMEKRSGKEKPVIKKALVDLEGRPFLRLKQNRKHWAMNEDYIYPDPIQYFGPPSVTDKVPIILELESL